MLNQYGTNSLADLQAFKATQVYLALNQKPLGFIDVGARGGTHELVAPIARLTQVLGFEADREECVRLLQNQEVVAPWAKFHLEPIALYDREGESTLHLLSANTNHSLLPPNEQFTQRYRMDKWQVVGQSSLQTVTLDNVLKKNHFGYELCEFIKLDTQGTEYEILQGAKEALSQQTVAIMTEVAFCELYRGQKLFSEVEAFLRELGFSFYGFTRLHTRSKKLLDKKQHITRERTIYTDAIFFKDPLAGQKISDRGHIVLFTTALLLGFYDFAWELAEASFAHHNMAEQTQIKNLILEVSRLSSQKTQEALTNLVTTVNQQPEFANIAVGGFVDQRREYCDYDDVLNISPLPKTL